MFGTFFGINVATSGLRVQQQALDVVSHNVANANTPGYKRQKAVIVEGNAVSGSFANSTTGFTAMGTGVRVENIERTRVGFVEARVRTSIQLTGQWEMQSQTLQQIEDVFGEPSDDGLGSQLDKFWNAWGKVNNLAEDSANRIEVVNRAEGLAERIRTSYNQIQELRKQVDFVYRDKAGKINLIAEQIADLNAQIMSPKSGSFTPNELLNQRDLLVEELCQITGVQQFGESGMEFMLTMGGRVLVNGSVVNRVELGATPDGMAVVQWASDHEAVQLDPGELTGISTVRDQLAPAYLAQLDELTTTLISEVNALHQSGFGKDGSTGLEFFISTGTAADIRLNPVIKSNFNAIAASSVPDKPGDGKIAFEISGLRAKTLVGGLSINQMYRKMISNIAGDASVANLQAETQSAALNQARVQQQSVSGVSLDEEMTDMIRFQQAYNASARMISAMDEMLETLITRTGVVGR